MIFEGGLSDFGSKRFGKCKDFYANGALLSEGDYEDGKLMNGKGYKQNGDIEYEIKNGKGYIRRYDCKGIIMFEGEILNGEKNGKGKEYDYKGRLEFEGEYLNGERKKGQ